MRLVNQTFVCYLIIINTFQEVEILTILVRCVHYFVSTRIKQTVNRSLSIDLADDVLLR